MAFFSEPRGKRNNNPFNIDYSSRNDWDGQIGIEPKSPEGAQRFAAFSSPVFGARAFFKLMDTYKSKHKIDTVEKLVNRFAPSVENPTTEYASFIANALGVDVSDKIDLTDKDTALKVAAAKVKFENGVDVSSVISSDKLERAYELAKGKKYSKEEKELSQSRKKGDLPDSLVKALLQGSVLATEGDVESEVIASIQAQLAQQNVAQAAPQEVTEPVTTGLTAEEEAELQWLQDDLARRATEQEGEEFGLTEEEEAELDWLNNNLGVTHRGPAFEEPVNEHDVIQEIYG